MTGFEISVFKRLPLQGYLLLETIFTTSVYIKQHIRKLSYSQYWHDECLHNFYVISAGHRVLLL